MAEHDPKRLEKKQVRNSRWCAATQSLHSTHLYIMCIYIYIEVKAYKKAWCMPVRIAGYWKRSSVASCVPILASTCAHVLLRWTSKGQRTKQRKPLFVHESKLQIKLEVFGVFETCSSVSVGQFSSWYKMQASWQMLTLARTRYNSRDWDGFCGVSEKRVPQILLLNPNAPVRIAI
jgi:hypothetical protein